jgi:hypothetical protein
MDEEGNPVIKLSVAQLPPAGDSQAFKLQAQTRLQQFLGKEVQIANLLPILNSQGETVGYAIWLARENVPK